MRDYAGMMTVASVVLVVMEPFAAWGHCVFLVVATCPILVPVVFFVGMRRKASAEPCTTYL